MKNYQKAIRYATKLIKNYNAPYSPRDLVHDSFVQYHKYQNTNLFEAEEGKIMKVVKNAYFNTLNSKYTTVGGKSVYNKGVRGKGKGVRGEKVKKEYRYLDDKNETFILKEIETPESIIISKENIKNLNDYLCEFDKKVLSLRFQGYKSKEIEDILDTHNVKIAKSIKNIKKQMHTKSPFNGCKVTVVKRVKRSVFESDKENYLKEWEMGEDSDFNDSYVLMTSKTNPKEGLLIKEKGSD